MTIPTHLPAEASPRAGRIAIAEDDPASAAMLQTMLVRTGYDVAMASDGMGILRLLEEGELPDVVLLDWMLPGITGLEACHRIRQRWDALQLPILMVTAKTDAESISAAFDAGASDYITKPFLGAELRARIAAHLRTRRLVEERRRMEEHLGEREKLSNLGLLVSGVAHDLNNPLAGISGYAQLLLRREADIRARSDLQRILSEAERCQAIVGDLLGFVRRRPASRGPVDVERVLRGVLEMREGSLRAAGIAVRADRAPATPPVWGDAQQLQQVFLNILVNAEYALRSGGREIRVRTRTEASEAQEWLIVELGNDAPPIPPEVLPHIWDPFYTTKPEDQGTGLGLAICRRIVQEHGGTLEAESRAEETVFRIRLPVMREP